MTTEEALLASKEFNAYPKTGPVYFMNLHLFRLLNEFGSDMKEWQDNWIVSLFSSDFAMKYKYNPKKK